MSGEVEAEKHHLGSGLPCVKHGCVLCCIETRMPLSCMDMERILRLGYHLDDFATRTMEGWRLKNRSGRCIFLSERGCKIYPHRPEGCQLYPLVYDEDMQETVLDSLCPYRYEFRVRKGDMRRLLYLFERLRKETACC